MFNTAVTVNDELYTWGANHYGELDNGTTENCIVPTKITIIDKSHALGDITGDEVIDSSDASKVLMVYTLISTGKDAELTIDKKMLLMLIKMEQLTHPIHL